MNRVAVQLFSHCMQALAAHLKRKNQKLLQQQLSLPKIEERVHPVPQTSARARKPKLTIKYVSQTTLSPEEEHIQDQIRLVLNKESVKDPYDPWRTPLTQPKTEKNPLPKILEAQTPSRRGSIDSRAQKNYSMARKSRSNHSKLDLDSILKDRSGFIENYFAQIRAQLG